MKAKIFNSNWMQKASGTARSSFRLGLDEEKLSHNIYKYMCEAAVDTFYEIILCGVKENFLDSRSMILMKEHLANKLSLYNSFIDKKINEYVKEKDENNTSPKSN